MGRGLLLIVSGLVVIVGISKINVQKQIEYLPENTVDYYYEQQARNISISLVDEAIQMLLKDNDWTGTIETNENYVGSGTLKSYDQTTISQLSDSVTVKQWDQYTVVLYSEAEYEGYRISTEVLMSRDSFSKYSYYTNTQPTNIYFTSKDTLSGPVHTNGTFRIAGNPVFNGFVTSPAGGWIGHSSYSNNPQFNGGSNFNAPVKSFDVRDQVNELVVKANSGGLSFNTAILVQPKANGTVDISVPNGIYWSTPTNYDMSTFNGIITSTEEIDITGTVNGQLTIHSAKDIEIIGDVTYNTDPRVDITSTDFLGLVAEQEIRVDQYAHTFSGSGNLNIHASMMAMNRSFYVEDYTLGSPRGVLNILGGLIQEERGPVSTFNRYGLSSGYSKDYEYDERLRYNIPPSFPRERVFSILHWKDKVISRPTSSS